MPIIEIKHPLVKHKIGLMRHVDISTKSFRELTAEIGQLLAYEACAEFPLETVTIQGWNGPVEVQQISGKKVTLVPILRAGLGMLEDKGQAVEVAFGQQMPGAAELDHLRLHAAE